MQQTSFLISRTFSALFKIVWLCVGLFGLFSLYAVKTGKFNFLGMCGGEDGRCADGLCTDVSSAERYDVIVIPFDDLKTHYPRGRQSKIQGIVLHAPTIPSVFKTISVLQNRSVGCHYIIPNTTLFELQKEAKTLLQNQDRVQESEKLSPVALNACHLVLNFQGSRDRIPVIQLADDHTGVKQAGLGRWKNWTCDGDGKLNSATIGIECANSSTYQSLHMDLFRYSDMQTQVLSALLKDLLTKHTLVGSDIVAHSDIAWDRPDDAYKQDPGPYFPYEALARHRLGLVPLAKDFPPLPKHQSEKEMIMWVQTCFQRMGYRPCPITGVMGANTLKILRAYALHFFPQCPAYKPGYDFGPLVNSLQNHPWAVFHNPRDEVRLTTGIEIVDKVGKALASK
jgi:N-acetyl-anhydromuramyl-L-alanine amidase AmpD